MADKKITDLAALTTPDVADLLEVADVSAGISKKVRVDDLRGSGGAAALSWNALPTLQNSWVAAGDPTTPGYAKEGNFVYLRGRISGGTSTDDTLLFTLPADHRPPNTVYFDRNSITGSAAGTIGVFNDGQVKLAFGGLANINLNGIQIPIN